MKKILIIILALVMALSLVACGDENSKIEDVIRENAKAMEQEDVEAYMETIHADTEIFEQTKQSMTMIFELYDLKVKIVEIEVLEVGDEEAKVRVIQETTNENDEPFDANTATAVHTLVKVDGVWKITSTELESADLL